MLFLEETTVDFCASTANIWQVVGVAVTIIKIVIPLILIILGMVDLGKAVVSNDEKEINKSVTKLVKRFIAAVVIFFVPTIINAFFSVLDVTHLKTDAGICVNCLTAPNGDACEKAVPNALGF